MMQLLTTKASFTTTGVKLWSSFCTITKSLCTLSSTAPAATHHIDHHHHHHHDCRHLAPSKPLEIDWDSLGFKFMPTDYMYTMKCSHGENFSKGELQRFGNIELNPCAGVLNYGQGLFEGLKAHRKHDDSNILLFRPQENALRLKSGAERMCMPSPSVQQFVEAVKLTVLANERWIPPPGKGSLYIRPLLVGTGAVLGLAPAPEYTLWIYASPVGNYFKEGLAPINLLVETETPRATAGGTGGVKTIGNYAAGLKAQIAAKAKGFSDVLYLDSVHKRYVEEVSACNVFVVRDNVISTPAINGTILPGITRKSVIDIARRQGFQVEERLVTVDELLVADEVFCTGTAVVISPVGSITYLGKRVIYGRSGVQGLSQQLYSTLTSLQMGLATDKMDWIVQLKSSEVITMRNRESAKTLVTLTNGSSLSASCIFIGLLGVKEDMGIESCQESKPSFRVASDGPASQQVVELSDA